MTSAAQQLITLGWMVVTGAGVGLVFDLYRVARGLIRPRWLLTALGDGLFWLFVAAFTYGVLLKVNFGEVRSFIFFGILLGLWLYYRLLSPLVIKLSLQFLGVAGRLFAFGKRMMVGLLFRPVARLLAFLFAPFRRLWLRLLGLAAKGKEYAKGVGGRWGKSLRRVLRLLYRLLKYKLLFFTRKK